MLGPAWVSAFQEVPLAVSAGTRRAPRVPGPADAPRTPGRLLGAGGTPPARAPGHPRGAGVNSRAGPASAYLAVAQRRGRGHGAQGASGSGGLPGGVRRQRSAARSLAGGARPARRQRPRRLRGGGSQQRREAGGGRRAAGGALGSLRAASPAFPAPASHPLPSPSGGRPCRGPSWEAGEPGDTVLCQTLATHSEATARSERVLAVTSPGACLCHPAGAPGPQPSRSPSRPPVLSCCTTSPPELCPEPQTPCPGCSGQV